MSWFSHDCHGQQHCSWVHTHHDDSGDDYGVAQHGCHTPNIRLTETCSLGLPCTSLILDIHVMINWHLSKQGVCWPVSHSHIAGSSVQLIEVTCCFRSWPLTKCWFTCWKQGRIVQKPVNASPGIKFSRIITFSSIQMFFAALFWVYGDYKTQNRKSNSKQKTSPQSYKTHYSTFYLFLG